VEHAQAALDLDGEVDVTRRVDDVDAEAGACEGTGFGLPEGGRRCRRDGDAALLLLLHPVHGRGAVMDFADLMRLAGVVEDALGRGRLAGVDMRHDTDVAVLGDGGGAGHWRGLSWRFWPLYQR